MNKPENILLDIDALLAGEWLQCQTLLNGSYPMPSEGNHKPIDKEQLLSIQQKLSIKADDSLLEVIESRLEPTMSLGQNFFSIVKFTDQLFENYSKNSKVHPDISRELKQLRPLIVSCLLNEKLPWLDKQQPITTLQLISQHCVGWQPSLGRAAERFIKALSPLLETLAHAVSSDELSIAIDALKKFFKAEQQRIKKLEKRLRDVEIGALHAKHANQLSAKILNQQMAGKKLPAAAIHFLQSPWRKSMCLLIINEGKDSDAWKHMLRLTETLVLSFQPTQKDSQQRVYDSISELSEELRKVTIGLHHSGKLDEELLAIEHEHLKILKGESLSYVNFELIDNTDPIDNTQTELSSRFLKSASSFDEGQWFIYQADGEEKRIKLTVKTNEEKQLLFTNFLGIKVEQYSFDEFAYLVSSKIATPIKPTDPFKATGEKIISTLLENYQLQKKQLAAEKAIEEEIIKQRNKDREQALKEARLLDKKKQQERLQTEQKKKALKQRQEQAQQAKIISNQLEQLKIGGRVTFTSHAEEDTLCRLVAILQSSGEYIFVDRLGIKQHSLRKQQLADKIVSHEAKIIDPGSGFENTLEKVVNDLRTRK